MDTTYIVSGHMRSGTSMMMRCLVAGGMRAAYDESRNRMNMRHGGAGYVPNPAGYYELKTGTVRAIGFPRGFEGMLIKVLWNRVTAIAAGQYKIVYMVRDPVETAESVRRFWGRDEEDETYVANKAERIARANEVTIGILQERRDVELVVASYHDILDCPTQFFKDLKRSGWPIRSRRAADEVDLTMYRNRKCLPCGETRDEE